MIVSIKEAREILGKDAAGMTDDEIEFVIETLDLMAVDALKLSKEELIRKRDAKQLADLTYDLYRESQNTTDSQATL